MNKLAEVFAVLKPDLRVDPVKVSPGIYIVPAGCWRTASTSTPTRMLFITPGEGAGHREE